MRNDIWGIPIWFALLAALWVVALGLVIAFVLFFNSPQETVGQSTGNGSSVEGGEAPEGSGDQEQADQQQGQEADQSESQQEDAQQEGGEQQASGENGGDGDADGEQQASAESGAPAEAWYAEEQADRGQEAYAENCVSCHGEELQGQAGQPALAGEEFLANWETVGELYDYTRESMPQDDPGSLEDQTYADILAHVLRVNGYPSGDEELPADSDALAEMTLSAEAVQAEGPSGEGEAEGDGQQQQEAEAQEQQADEGEQDDQAQEPQAQGQQDQQAQQDQDPSAQEQQSQQQDQEQQDQDQEQAAGAQDAQEGQEDGQADGETQAAGTGQLEIRAEPAQATINVLGPDGYRQRLDAAGTLQGLEPGQYVVAASRGHESRSATASVEADATSTVTLVLDELARSNDVPEASEDDPRPEMPAFSQAAEEAGSEQPQAEGGQQADEQQDADQQNGDQQDGDQQNGQQQDGQQQDGQQQNGEQQNGGQQDGEQQDGQQGEDAPQEGEAQQAASDDGEGESDVDGAQVYQDVCATCHGGEGEGASAPALAENQQLEDTQAVVTQIIEGGGGMPPFGDQLSDQEIAAVATHVRTSWGNGFGEVTVDDVQQVSGDTSGGGASDGGNGGGGGNGGNGGDEAADGGQASQQEGEREPADAEGEQEQQAQDDQQAEGDQQAQDDQQAQESGQNQAQDGQGEGGEERRTQAARGEEAYANNCARCHGANLAGDRAPALAGGVFMDRWGGHPVDWLHFQAATSMPPHAPGSLDDRTYTDIIVYVLTENAILEEHASFGAGDEELLQLVIERGGEDADRTRRLVEEHRERILFGQEDEAEARLEGPITPDAEPVRPGVPWEARGGAPQVEEAPGGEADEAGDGEGGEGDQQGDDADANGGDEDGGDETGSDENGGDENGGDENGGEADGEANEDPDDGEDDGQN